MLVFNSTGSLYRLYRNLDCEYGYVQTSPHVNQMADPCPPIPQHSGLPERKIYCAILYPTLSRWAQLCLALETGARSLEKRKILFLAIWFRTTRPLIL